MSLHDPIPAARPNPGGATVADLRCMDGAQALCVMMFRDWFDGPEGRARVAGTFSDALGPFPAAAAIEAWTDLTTQLSDNARRPVMRHAITCRCVGADEAVVAQVLSLAARGEREDAMLILSLLVPGDRLLFAMQAAERAGLALLRIAARWRLDDASHSKQLH